MDGGFCFVSGDSDSTNRCMMYFLLFLYAIFYRNVGSNGGSSDQVFFKSI